MADPSTHIFRVALRPRLYREIETDGGKSLYDLAEATVRAFGFDLDHAFGFYSKLTGNYAASPVWYELFADMEGKSSDAGSVKRTKVARAFPAVGKTMLFLFDYGNEWRFEVELVGMGKKIPKMKYHKVLATMGKAPPQY